MSRRFLFASLLLLSACGPATGPDGATPTAAAESTAPAPRDAAALRADASRALSEQRFYAPAGDNAIEHYLALRDLAPGDEAVQLALLELLPYPVIASEQAIGRSEFAEARRLLALVERTDPAAPALARLRDSLADAEAAEARRVVQEAEAEKQRELEAARLAAGADATTSPASRATPEPSAPAAAATAPAAAASPVASVPPPVAAPAGAAAPSPSPAVPVRADPDAAAPIVPRVASAPSPRYPALALRRRIEGEVTVAFTVRADGGVESPRVVSATPSGVFEEAALAAIQRWRFEPVARPVESRQVLRFRLPGREGT